MRRRHRPKKKAGSGQIEGNAMEFCFAIRPKMPNEAHRNCLIALEVQDMMDGRFSDMAVLFRQEDSQTVIGSYLRTDTPGL